MAFNSDSADVRIAELTMEVGRRWNWEADVVPSILRDRLAIVLNDEIVGYLDTALFRIIECPKERP